MTLPAYKPESGQNLHRNAPRTPHQVGLQRDQFRRAVGKRLGAHADHAVAQAALERTQRLPFEAIERITGRVPLRQGDAGELLVSYIIQLA